MKKSRHGRPQSDETFRARRIGQLGRTARGPYSGHRSLQRRLRLEPLEDRTLLALVYVDAGNVPGPGSGTFADPFLSIQDGIDAASPLDEVQVAAGRYTENFTMKSGVDVTGAGAFTTKLVGTASLSGVVLFENVVGAELSGFTITVGVPVAGVDRGVVFRGATDSTAVMQRNVIHDAEYGIYVDAPAAPTILNNTLVGVSDEQGIFVDNEPFSPAIRNNIITGYSFAGIHVAAGSTAPTPVIEYNDVWNNTTDYENYPDQTGSGGNISTDPLFVAPANYHLQFGSPCVDSGDPSGALVDPDGTRADMGAFAVDQTMSVSLTMPSEALYIGQYAKISVVIDPGSGLSIDDLEFVVADGPAAGEISLSRDDLFDPANPDVMLLGGYEPGTYTLVAEDKATQAVVGEGEFTIAPLWTGNDDGDGSVLGIGDNFVETDRTDPNFPVDFRVDVIDIDGTKAEVRIRYGVILKPDPSIRPGPALWGQWQSPDILVENALNLADPVHLFNMPWLGHENTVIARVTNSGDLDAQQVRVNFTTTWKPPKEGIIIVVRIPLYQTPTNPSIVEMTEMNNFAYSAFDRMVSSSESPASREISSITVSNPFDQRTEFVIMASQTNPLYRTFIEHRWLELDPGETKQVQVMFEYMYGELDPNHPLVEEYYYVPNDVTLVGLIRDPRGDEEADGMVVFGGVQVQVVTGRATEIVDFALDVDTVFGRVTTRDDGNGVPGGKLLVEVISGAGASPRLLGGLVGRFYRSGFDRHLAERQRRTNLDSAGRRRRELYRQPICRRGLRGAAERAEERRRPGPRPAGRSGRSADRGRPGRGRRLLRNHRHRPRRA